MKKCIWILSAIAVVLIALGLGKTSAKAAVGDDLFAAATWSQGTNYGTPNPAPAARKWAEIPAEAGATYVSPFVGRLDDINEHGTDLIRTISEIFAIYDYDTEIIAASIRNVVHVTECALAGADIATVPFKVIMQMVKHPLTDQGIEKFQADYKAVFGE